GRVPYTAPGIAVGHRDARGRVPYTARDLRITNLPNGLLKLLQQPVVALPCCHVCSVNSVYAVNSA
ncbi:MAG: hypothetical protein FWE59_06385, partial [Oscillospiraceae bacterium]|nr:hypothetical protein [Oscillospiraceae bacterium]